MTPNKQKLQNIIDSLNCNPMISVKRPDKDGVHKITLTEDLNENSVTLDLGYLILKEHLNERTIDDSVYGRLYDSFISRLFKDHLRIVESDFLNKKIKQ